jgi:hypothetical protein
LSAGGTRSLTAGAAAFILVVSLSSGGHRLGAASIAALALAVLLAVRAVAFPATLVRPSWPALAAMAGLAALAVWSLVSVRWSHALGRALEDTVRILLYLLAVANAATLPTRALRPLLRGIVLGIVTAVLVGLATRLLPDLLPADQGDVLDRLGYPLRYHNAVGLLAALGVAGTAYVATDRGEATGTRLAALATWPALGSALYLTQSRGAMAVAVLGVLAYLVLARPPIGVLAAGLPPALIAVLVTYGTVSLVSVHPAPGALPRDGYLVLAVVVLCAAAAVVLGRAVIAGSIRVPRARPPAWARRHGRGVLVAAVAAALVAGVAGRVPERLYDAFIAESSSAVAPADPRGRLTTVSSTGRAQQWRAALEASEPVRWRGTGAGTFAVIWTQRRTNGIPVFETHSLYVETLAELGAPGVLALAVVFAGLLGGALRRLRRHRAAVSLALSFGGMWALHSALEWHWEMPAVTLPVLVALAAASATRPGRSGALRAGLVAIAAVAAALPAVSALSEWRLDAALAAYRAGDCPTAVVRARAASRWIARRPEPYAVTALCAARQGRRGAGAAAAEAAIARDPQNAEYRVIAAIVDIVTGADPQRRLEEARRLDPYNSHVFVFSSSRTLDLAGVEQWARRVPVVVNAERLPPVGGS